MNKKLLKAHQKTNIRFQEGDFIFYEPNAEQLLAIKGLLEENVQITEDMNIEGSLAFKSVRFIIRELTNIGNEIDGYTDVELQTLLDNGDRQLQLLLRSITDFINEIVDNILEDYMQQLKLLRNYIKIINNSSDVEEMKTEMNELFKKNEIDLTFDELSKIYKVDDDLADKLVSKKKKTNKNK